MGQRVAVLGGGMAGLAAAWHLSEPGRGNEVTVYQRGHRLGGKGASSRGRDGRIEEHGFHVWLGHYDNAFRLLRACYAALDRPRTDPACPIRTWRDGFVPANFIGLGEHDEDGWSAWLARFPHDDRLPGEPEDGTEGTTTLGGLVARLAALLGRLGGSMQPPTPTPRAVLSAHPRPPTDPSSPAVELVRGLTAALVGISGDARSRRRAGQFADFLAAVARGVVAEGRVLGSWTDLDDVDISDWLRRHGASDATLAGPWVRGLHDLAFGYADGDLDRPRFPAGLGLLLASKSFVDYKGALFWKMTAGMGDVVIAPLHQALRARGVRFRFFHRLVDLEPVPGGGVLGAVTLAEQVRLAPGVDEYDPLVRVGGLPVFPDRPDLSQLDAPPAGIDVDLEAHGAPWVDAATVRLEHGRDFEVAVLATSIGMLPHVAPSLLDADPRWRSMVEHVPTVGTRAFQIWLDVDERALGARYPGASITGLGGDFDTFASMTHLLAREQWPDPGPRSAATFCSVVPEASLLPEGHPDRVRQASADVRAAAVRFLEERGPDLWPATGRDGGFDWSALSDRDGRRGEDRFDAQYWRVNLDPSDRYVQAAPGSAAHRIRPDDSGFEHLVLAGDWTDNGVNVGCIEAAVVSGLQAANAVEGRPIGTGVSFWRPQHPARAAAGVDG